MGARGQDSAWEGDQRVFGVGLHPRHGVQGEELVAFRCWCPEGVIPAAAISFDITIK